MNIEESIKACDVGIVEAKKDEEDTSVEKNFQQ